MNFVYGVFSMISPQEYNTNVYDSIAERERERVVAHHRTQILFVSLHPSIRAYVRTYIRNVPPSIGGLYGIGD
jgi:hypothetical protein